MPRRLRIGILTYASGGTASGVGRYVASLIARSPSDAALFAYGPRTDAPALDPSRKARWFPGGRWHRSAWRDLLWHHLVLPAIAAIHRLDVVFAPIERRCPLLMPCPTVVTVHDLAPLLVPGKYGWASRVLFGTILPTVLVRRRLIAVSRVTARDLMRHYAIDRRAIRVVHNGGDGIPDPPMDGRDAEASPTARPFLLYPARLEHPGKNHVLAIAALARYLAMPDSLAIDLVCPGAPWQGEEEIRSAIRSHGLGERVHLMGWITDDALARLYRCALGLAFPSRYEGFGLPLVEAMRRGLPIVATPCGAIPEVAGEAALYASPDDVEGFARALRQVLHDAAVRQRLVTAGRARVGLFTWDRCAGRTWALVRAAVR